jgi:hypothetical protein
MPMIGRRAATSSTAQSECSTGQDRGRQRLLVGSVRDVGGEGQQDWLRFDWPSVRVDGVSSAGTRRVAAWGRHDDGRVVMGLIEGGSLARVLDVPTDTARQGPVRAVRWGQVPDTSRELFHNLVGVCGPAGLWRCAWSGDISPATVAADEQGREARHLWPVAGDEDLRVVAAYGSRRELRVLGGGFPLRLLPPTNRLEVHGRIEDVLVASHSGVVAVAGDLRLDGAPAECCYAWAWSGFFEHGEDERYSREWQAQPIPPSVRITDMADDGSDVHLAGLHDGQPQTWGLGGFPDYPDGLDCPTGEWTGTLLPDVENYFRWTSMVAVGRDESLLLVAGLTEPLRLPTGQVQAVAVDKGVHGDPVRHFAVVDGALYGLALDDAYSYWS